jgi:riboflavin transporter FmnP
VTYIAFLLGSSLLATVVTSWHSSAGRASPTISVVAGLVITFVLAANAYTLFLPWWEWASRAVQSRAILANAVIPVAVALVPACISHLTAQFAMVRGIGDRRIRMVLALAIGLIATASTPILLYVASCGVGGECA